MAWRSRPHAHTCGTSPGWLASIDVRVSEASNDLGRLAQDSRSVIRHEAPMTCAVNAAEARPVRVQLDGGHWACKVAGAADDLQPSGGLGRVCHRARSATPEELVPEKVKVAVPLFKGQGPGLVNVL